MLTRFTLTQKQINGLKYQIAHEEGVLEEDISDADVFEYMKRVSDDRKADSKLLTYKVGPYVIEQAKTLSEVIEQYQPW